MAIVGPLASLGLACSSAPWPAPPRRPTSPCRSSGWPAPTWLSGCSICCPAFPWTAGGSSALPSGGGGRRPAPATRVRGHRRPGGGLALRRPRRARHLPRRLLNGLWLMMIGSFIRTSRRRTGPRRARDRPERAGAAEDRPAPPVAPGRPSSRRPPAPPWGGPPRAVGLDGRPVLPALPAVSSQPWRLTRIVVRSYGGATQRPAPRATGRRGGQRGAGGAVLDVQVIDDPAARRRARPGAGPAAGRAGGAQLAGGPSPRAWGWHGRRSITTCGPWKRTAWCAPPASGAGAD